MERHAPLVEVRDLTVKFVSRDATVRAVNGVSFDLMPGEVLCVIGESGSGKSVTMRALMRLLPTKRTQIGGSMRVGSHDILSLSERELRDIRGAQISMIFQEPMTALDPVFTIGDLSTVWLVAYVRESEAPKVRAGQQLDFSVLAYPKTTFKANIDHVAASLDPSIRRLLVRATIDNSNGQFKPEMFTSVTIYTDEGDSSIGVPREAVIYEADNARVWVARADKTIEVRQIKTGFTRGSQIQVLQGLQPGEIVVTKGSLFVDQAAGS